MSKQKPTRAAVRYMRTTGSTMSISIPATADPTSTGETGEMAARTNLTVHMMPVVVTTGVHATRPDMMQVVTAAERHPVEMEAAEMAAAVAAEVEEAAAEAVGAVVVADRF
jgi:purine-nucleoside phosphorylase